MIEVATARLCDHCRQPFEGASWSQSGLTCRDCFHGRRPKTPPSGDGKRPASQSRPAPSGGAAPIGPAFQLSTPVTVRLADVAPEPVAWLWRPYVPLGKLTIVQGDPQVGKSWLSLALATAVTTGTPLPGGERREPANVVILTAEDGLADTVRPRLDAMGADVSRVFALTAIRQNDGERPFSLAADLPALETAIMQHRPALVTIDPLSAYLGGHVDAWRDNEVRGVLGPVAALAERHSVAVEGVAHLTKGRRDHAIYRGQGSIAFAAAARSILLVGESPETPGLRVLAHIKGNLAPRGPSLGFSLDGGRFGWTGEVDIDADALLAPPEPSERGAREEAEAFLREVLSDGPVAAQEIERDRKAVGISERTYWRAKAALGIVAERRGEPGKRGGGTWYWRLPDLGCHPINTSSVAPLIENESERGQDAADSGSLNADAEEVLF